MIGERGADREQRSATLLASHHELRLWRLESSDGRVRFELQLDEETSGPVYDDEEVARGTFAAQARRYDEQVEALSEIGEEE